MKNKSAQELGSVKSEKKAAAARLNGAKGGRPRIHLEVGDAVTVALKSTGVTDLEITHVGFTAEVNGHDINEDGVAQSSFGGMPVNDTERVPACIGVDRNGITHAIYLWRGKWRGSNHRIFQFSREWETQDGNLLTPEVAKFVDEALTH